MSRKQYTNRNNINKVISFQKSGSTSSFDPSLTFTSGSRRVSWRLDNGSGTTQTAGNSITYTGFTSDNGIRNIQMRSSSLKNINSFSLDNDNLYGEIDLSSFENFSGPLILSTNSNLTGVTNPTTSNVVSVYTVASSNITGNLDLTTLPKIDTIIYSNNPNLTGVTHTSNNHATTYYQGSGCNIIGNLDLSYFTNLSSYFRINNNSNLTGITHSNNANNFSNYYAYNCNLTGNLNLTPLSGLGGDFQVYSNPNLTGITHSPSPNTFFSYYAYACNLKGNLDLTPLSGIGGDFRVFNNPQLTGITHSPSPNNFNIYWVSNCNLTGNLDLTPLSGLGGEVIYRQNSSLTSVTHSTSVRNIFNYEGYSCNLTGTLDLSPLTKLGNSTNSSFGRISIYGNPNLKNIIFPTSTQFFRNLSNGSSNFGFTLYSCDLDYIDFKPLSGATLVSGVTDGRCGIELQNNGMTTTDVNHILVDFSGNATYNPTGWSNINLNIGGTNGAPDSSSGGYDGIAARNFLTGSPYNWTITHT